MGEKFEKTREISAALGRYDAAVTELNALAKIGGEHFYDLFRVALREHVAKSGKIKPLAPFISRQVETSGENGS